MFGPVDFQALDIDPIFQQLQTLALAETLAGDPYRAQVVRSIIELYLSGKIDVAFTKEGQPLARLRPESSSIVAAPLFTTPSLVPPKEEERRIGFKPSRLS